MNHFRLPISVAAVVVLAACTAIPATDLPAVGSTVTISSEQQSEEAYRHVVRGARSCFSRFYEVTGDYFPQRQEGSVTVAMKSGVAMSAAALIEVRPTPAGSSVQVSSHPSATAMPQTVRSWLAGAYTVCDIAK